MANLSKTKALFAFTSPRTIEKIIPEIKILTDNFKGQKWSANSKIQADFFQKLFDSEFYEGDVYPSDPALAARDRITRAPKALGFVDLKPEIKLTQVGKLLLSNKRIEETFTRQLLKFQLPSPYHTQSKTINFCVKPYLELLRLISDLGSLSKTEIALFFCQLTSFNKYDDVIKKINKFKFDSKKFKGSRKMYIAQCFEIEIREIFQEQIANKDLGTRESSDSSIKKFIATKRSNMKDYADAFVRYIRSTELITFQKRTYRLIIAETKKEEVDYILNNNSRKPIEFVNITQFKTHLFNPFSVKLLTDDKDLLLRQIENLGIVGINKSSTVIELKDKLDEIRSSIKRSNVIARKRELKDYSKLPSIIEVFDKIKKKEVPDAPLFLEWNVWRALVMLNFAIRVDGNFIMDIDGMPLNYAPGKKPDIESEYSEFGMITEVTMSGGNTQYKMESESVPRHFGKAKEAMKKEMYCLFIAPKISEGTLAHYFNLNRINTKLYGGKTKIIPLNIDQFVSFIQTGIKNSFNNPMKLRTWMEYNWNKNQSIGDELEWSESIDKSIINWAL